MAQVNPERSPSEWHSPSQNVYRDGRSERRPVEWNFHDSSVAHVGQSGEQRFRDPCRRIDDHVDWREQRERGDRDWSCTDSSCATGAQAVCTEPASAGTFTIPPSVLLALPAGSAGWFILSTETESSVSATGIDVGLLGVGRYNLAGFGWGWGSGSFTLK